MFFRLCPRCGCQISHTIKSNRDQADKKQSLCKICGYIVRDVSGDKNPFYGKTHTTEARAKISAGDKSYSQTKEYQTKRSTAILGKRNPNYGISNYSRWVAKYGKEKANELNDAYRAKQSLLNSGCNNNMYGKPSPAGSGNGWSGWYHGNFFRSLLELSYIVKELDGKCKKWCSAERKDLTIPYIAWDGTQRTYRADFFVDDKYLIEVKPLKLQTSVSVVSKQLAAEKFCEEHGFIYKLESVEKISIEDIGKLRDDGLLVFTKRYEVLFLEMKNG